MEDFDKAIADYDKAIELKPEYAGAYYNRGIYFEMKGDFSNALDNFSKGLVFAKQQSDDDLVTKIENKIKELKKRTE